MGFFEDAWNWTKNAVRDVYDTVSPVVNTVKEIIPYVAPLLLKKGGMVSKEVKDTKANRRKILKFFNQHHKTKVTMALFNKIVDAKGKHPKLKLKA